jgi:cytochrome P450
MSIVPLPAAVTTRSASRPPAGDRVEFAFDDPAFQADPYATYAALREHEPFCYREFDGGASLWVTRYDDCLAALRDPRFRAAREVGGLQDPGIPQSFRRLGALLGHMMLLKDEPDHGRLRRLANKAFTPRVVERLRPRVEAVVDDLLDAVVRRGERRMDVIADLATPLPVIVIAELLGVPVTDLDRFKRWSDDIAVVLDGSVRAGGLPKAAESAAALGDYLRDVVAERRLEPQQDLISAMLAARDEHDALTDDELVANSILILLAGHETTTNLIGNGVLALLRTPNEYARLAADPSLAPRAVEECLRYDSPVQLTSRRMDEDLVFRGVPIAAHVEIDLVFGAAHRDPRHLKDPDRFDITRESPGHLAFGHGAHFCLGAPLARLEGEIALGRLAARMPSLALGIDTPPRRAGIVLRGLQALPVSFQ